MSSYSGGKTHTATYFRGSAQQNEEPLLDAKNSAFQLVEFNLASGESKAYGRGKLSDLDEIQIGKTCPVKIAK